MEKIITPINPDYRFIPIDNKVPPEYAVTHQSEMALSASQVPLSQIFHPDDNNCPVCGKQLPLMTGLIFHNPQGYVVCKECIRKVIPE